MTPDDPAHGFLAAKARALRGRARRLRRLTPATVGLRRQDAAFAPTPAHFAAANRRLEAIDRDVALRLGQLAKLPRQAEPQDALVAMAMVEREVDRARRTFGMLFEVFAQRGTAFAPSLAAHDVIAADCYAAVARAAPRIFGGPVLKPITYMEHGYSPATMRRGVTLARLLGESNPFPLIRIPYDRDQPWQAVFLHEVAHNLQADLGLWEENRQALLGRLATQRLPPLARSIFGRWHKEIFADLAALLLGGPAAAFGMAAFLSHPADKVMTYRPGGAHPTGFFRILILAEMLRRMGFGADADRLGRGWRRLYDPARGHRLPKVLLDVVPRAIPAVVDEIVHQPRRALSERTLARVIPFTAADEATIRDGARQLARGAWPEGLPPRFVVGAAAYAVGAGADTARLTGLVTEHLAASKAKAAAAAPTVQPQPRPALPPARAAA